MTTSSREIPAFHGALLIPEANKYVVLLDSTDPSGGLYKNTRSAALPTPGAALGTVKNKVFDITVKCTGANVTLTCLCLDPFGQWEIPYGGQATVVAGEGSQPIRLHTAGTAGVAVVVQAGATPPSTLAATVTEAEE